MGIYLDNNSSSPIDERVLAVMVDPRLVSSCTHHAERAGSPMHLHSSYSYLSCASISP